MRSSSGCGCTRIYATFRRSVEVKAPSARADVGVRPGRIDERTFGVLLGPDVSRETCAFRPVRDTTDATPRAMFSGVRTATAVTAGSIEPDVRESVLGVIAAIR
jgi:hypothetical protein